MKKALVLIVLIWVSINTFSNMNAKIGVYGAGYGEMRLSETPDSGYSYFTKFDYKLNSFMAIGGTFGYSSISSWKDLYFSPFIQAYYKFLFLFLSFGPHFTHVENISNSNKVEFIASVGMGITIVLSEKIDLGSIIRFDNVYIYRIANLYHPRYKPWAIAVGLNYKFDL
ncbi:MAG: hypothetical protein KAS64_08400 [Spirochaetes bacterium]|nr:hypothetical protein [Spirochaetota bacterium]